MDDTADFRPTHVAPTDGLATWAHPDFSEPSARLDALLPVHVAEVRGDWARVVCSNGWTGWADGRLLVTLPQRPPAVSRPLAATADPRPLLLRLEHALTQYREAAEDLADGSIDLETFRHLTHGLRLGAVLDGEAGWLLDLDEGRWYYCDGLRMHTLATTDPASASAAPSAHEPSPHQPSPHQPSWRERASREPEPRGPEPRGASLREPEPREPAPRGASPRQPEPREASPREPEPREASPREPEPREASPREPEPREASPREPEPREASPREPARYEPTVYGTGPGGARARERAAEPPGGGAA